MVGRAKPRSMRMMRGEITAGLEIEFDVVRNQFRQADGGGGCVSETAGGQGGAPPVDNT